MFGSIKPTHNLFELYFAIPYFKSGFVDDI